MEKHIDGRIREAVFPVAVSEVSGKIEGAERFLSETDLQIGLSETHLIAVRGKGYVVLDFGRELHGSVRILTQAAEDEGCQIRIRAGESVSEACAELGEKNAGNFHTLRDVRAYLPMYSDMEFFQTGFRFVRIDFLEDKLVYIKAVLATSVGRDLRPVGSFECDDGRVNEIFQTAARTLMLNIQTYIWDGIKRDRLVWVGDMHPETMGISCLFGSDPSVEKSLDYMTSHTPYPEWMNNTPTYTAWWIVILCDYYMQNGDGAYLRKNGEYLKNALRLLLDAVTEEGIVEAKGCLFDWPSHDTEDEKIGVHALWTLAAKKAEYLFSRLGFDPAPCKELLSRLSRNARLSVEKYKQCEAFLVYAGLKEAKDSYAFLTKGGAKGFSSFMSYYILRAIALTDAERAVALMKEYYGGMLDMGATTFWEDFDVEWMENSSPIDRLPQPGERDIHGDFGNFCYVGFRHSLCHGWSCGPVSFLMREVGGIEILEPGCRKMRIKPVAAGFSRYRIDYPTPYGSVVIEWKDGKFSVSVPDGIEVCG